MAQPARPGTVARSLGERNDTLSLGEKDGATEAPGDVAHAAIADLTAQEDLCHIRWRPHLRGVAPPAGFRSRAPASPAPRGRRRPRPRQPHPADAVQRYRARLTSGQP